MYYYTVDNFGYVKKVVFDEPTIRTDEEEIDSLWGVDEETEENETRD